VVVAMHALRDFTHSLPADSPFELELVSFPSVFEAIQDGVDSAMLLSTLSVRLPFSFFL